jgi:hypothetical protein
VSVHQNPRKIRGYQRLTHYHQAQICPHQIHSSKHAIAALLLLCCCLWCCSDTAALLLLPLLRSSCLLTGGWCFSLHVLLQLHPGEWRPLMEPTRDAARHLAARGVLEITQKGKVSQGAAGRDRGRHHMHYTHLCFSVMFALFALAASYLGRCKEGSALSSLCGL